MHDHWHSAWQRLDLAPPAGSWEDLSTRYAEPARAYHTLEHLAECFEQLDAFERTEPAGREVPLALWYHDAVYDSRAADNEARSADVAAAALRRAGAAPAAIECVRDLVLATRHAAPPTAGDAAIVCDVDLAILGADAARFDEYEAQVRLEYAWVDEPAFRAGRAAILERFLKAPSIYATSFFADRLERRARANLQRSIAALRSGT